MITKQHHRYLNPRVVLFQKQTNDETIFKEAFDARFENSPIAKKYYGRKMMIITKQTHLARALNHSKLFKDMTLLSKDLEAQNFKSHNNKIIFYNDVPITKSQLKRVLLSCKGKINFGDFFNFFDKQVFRMMRLSMRDIKQISLEWTYMNNIHFDTKSLASLRRLEKLNLNVESSFDLPANQKYCISDDYEASNLTLFLQNITNLPRLRTFFLCFKGILMETDLVLNLLLLVANSNVTNWHINIIMPTKEVKNIHVLKPVLAKINTLGIFTLDASLKPDEIRVPDQSGNHQVLGIYFQESPEFVQHDLQINLYPILKCCTSLRTLSIGFTRSQFFYKKEKDDSDCPTWTHRLSSILLLASFNYTFGGKDFSFMEEILKKVQKESKNLANLSVLTSKICPVLKNRTIWDTAILEGHNLVCDQIVGTKSLKSIQVSLQTSHFPHLHKLTTSSPNLVFLELRLSHPNSQNYWDDELPFFQLKNLKELRIYFNSFSDDGQWGDNLAHQITALQNLETLSIQTRTMLPNLKSLALETQITPTLPKDTQYFGLKMKAMVACLLQEIQQRVKYIIDVHKKIEYINICTFQISQLKCISYSRFNE